ncbi:hypothetical protein K443DRAFT_128984 [Laccaria amethystina LaAM-08-1]|uniref:Protein kinase domain-containing protein n=1 Tax=Laccaria amethystina LaAM-08-1 TaxID=1095629 RepID=A0A0C9XRG7_9AGAR|nr:hypothetical protein K443DRAFT_128984 [Laccaria amethystina LaAM-08-1]
MAAPAQTSPFPISLGKSVAQITAQFAPVPGLAPCVGVLCAIIQLCENVVQNRNAAQQLRDRCHYFVLALRDSEEKEVTKNIVDARNAVYECLLVIQTRMSTWANMGKIKSLIKQDDISKEISICQGQVSDCVARFQVHAYSSHRNPISDSPSVEQLVTQFEMLEWQKEFEANARRDHAELMESLSDIQADQALAKDMIRDMMSLMQTAMGENKVAAEKRHEKMSSKLYDLQRQSGKLLPDFHLKFGEVQKIGDLPVRGTATVDIFEGLYLGREKVMIKAIRSMKCDERSLRRFKREGKIWGEVWDRDQGRHIVPFYGFCQDGPIPFMVSPWMRNGDALSYVKANDKDLDYRQFIRDISLGVEVLHTMNPPIVHGDIKGSNILISDQGHPLLSDFGLSQIIHDVSGTPFTQSNVVADSYRYFAPEVCMGNGNLSTATDIYALAMTVLEVPILFQILTHQQPYRKIKHHMHAAFSASKGEQPGRPTEAQIVARGLDDNLWALLKQCWSLKPEERPAVQEYISRL